MATRNVVGMEMLLSNSSIIDELSTSYSSGSWPKHLCPIAQIFLDSLGKPRVDLGCFTRLLYSLSSRDAVHFGPN
ncbi:hypothetical protein J6590_011923 [Homalodisca vitripennis]|nr:hypothetical protein J6590_011923 [Homalodisca vitripennis]